MPKQRYSYGVGDATHQMVLDFIKEDAYLEIQQQLDSAGHFAVECTEKEFAIRIPYYRLRIQDDANLAFSEIAFTKTNDPNTAIICTHKPIKWPIIDHKKQVTEASALWTEMLEELVAILTRAVLTSVEKASNPDPAAKTTTSQNHRRRETWTDTIKRDYTPELYKAAAGLRAHYTRCGYIKNNWLNTTVGQFRKWIGVELIKETFGMYGPKLTLAGLNRHIRTRPETRFIWDMSTNPPDVENDPMAKQAEFGNCEYVHVDCRNIIRALHLDPERREEGGPPFTTISHLSDLYQLWQPQFENFATLPPALIKNWYQKFPDNVMHLNNMLTMARTLIPSLSISYTVAKHFVLTGEVTMKELARLHTLNNVKVQKVRNKKTVYEHLTQKEIVRQLQKPQPSGPRMRDYIPQLYLSNHDQEYIEKYNMITEPAPAPDPYPNRSQSDLISQ